MHRLIANFEVDIFIKYFCEEFSEKVIYEEKSCF